MGKISVVKYTDEDYEAVQKIFSEAFHRMKLSAGLESILSKLSEEEKSSYIDDLKTFLSLERIRKLSLQLWLKK